jgi:hypothetical protein
VLLRLDPDLAQAWSDEEVVALGPAFSASRQVAPTDACHRALDSMAAPRSPVDRDRARKAAKPELVYEVLEGAIVASCQPEGQDSRNFFREPV